MRTVCLTVLLATACGSDRTEIFTEDQNDYSPSDSVGTEPAYRDSAEHIVTDAGHGESVPTGTEESITAPTEAVEALCLSPDPRLLRYVRDSVGRFRERLEIPMVFGEGCLPIVVLPEVWDGDRQVSAQARYHRLCEWKACEARAVIEVAEVNLTQQVQWLPNLLDHEIGHVLSSWGSKPGFSLHLPDTVAVMSPVNRRENQWTQEDINMWCSAAPCGKTRIEGSWLSPISVVGTSNISDEGTDGGVPADAGALSDAGY